MPRPEDALRELPCCDFEEKVAWLRLHRKTNEVERHKPIVQTFCADCEPSWRRERYAEKKCIRSPKWKVRTHVVSG